VNETESILHSVRTVLVIDWPSRDVPEALAQAGFAVVVHGGPGPEDYSAYDCNEGQVTVRHLGASPERADLIYSHRPLTELPAIVAAALSLGARTIWVQSGVTEPGIKDPTGCWVPEDASRRARETVEAANLTYIEKPYIADAVREYRSDHR
jgi:predicted CoA-binding protein